MMTPELKKKSSNANPTPSAKPTMRCRLIDLTVYDFASRSTLIAEKEKL